MVKGRSTLTQVEKYLGFKRAFDTFSAHVSSGNVVAAFVVGFSIFEDRLTACFILAKDRAGQQRPADFGPLAKKIRFLASEGLISAGERDDWLKAAEERNALLHAAMWHVDVFQLEGAKKAVEFARTGEKLRRRLLRLQRSNKALHPTAASAIMRRPRVNADR